MHLTRLAIASLVLSTLLFSCTKPEITDPAQVSGPDRIRGNFTDGQRIVASTMIQDSLYGDETSLNLAGSMNDEIFGTTVAGFYCQPRLSSVNADFGVSPSLDSVVLSLTYYGYYGEIGSSQKF